MSIYNKFRSIDRLAGQYTLSKRFDEPTYFSFKLEFASNMDRLYNIATDTANFDIMPHPLFNTSRATEIAYSNEITTLLNETNTYSAIQYLVNANEPTRAAMLSEFIEKFNDLQKNYSYYFQQIDGISELLKIDPTKGQRILNDKKITITCLEGLDLRMSYLMNLYRKIAWDDVYQRWVLPDMMRYFTLKIYLAEFRTFHTADGQTGYGHNNNQQGKAYRDDSFNYEVSPQGALSYNLSQINSMKSKLSPMKNANVPVIPTAASSAPLYLKILDDILPTWEITCEMCEFDITDIDYTHLSGLNVAGDPPQGAVKFGVKIGNIKETQIYPTFVHMFLLDRKLNGPQRSRDETSTLASNNIKQMYPTYLQIAQNREYDEGGALHGSGLPFNERENQLTTQDTKGAIKKPKPSERLNTQFYNDKSGQEEEMPFDATRPETWIGNAVTFGVGYAKNYVKSAIGKAKITQIPSLGLSFSEITTAIQSKNITVALGMIRKGVDEVAKQYDNVPSSRLSQPIQTDSIMRELLSQISLSEATDDDDTQNLKATAAAALQNPAVWRQITDYSLSTNINNDDMEKSSTSGTIETGGLQVVAPSSKLGSRIQSDLFGGGEPSDKLGTSIQGDMGPRGETSEKLGTSIQGDMGPRGETSEKLGTSIQGDMGPRGETSEKLGTSIQGDMGPRGTAGEKLGTSIQGDMGPRGETSEKLGTSIQGDMGPRGETSEKLGTSIQQGGLQTIEPGVKLNSIDIASVIEYAPTSTIGDKISGEVIKQPEPGQAMRNKLQ